MTTNKFEIKIDRETYTNSDVRKWKELKSKLNEYPNLKKYVESFIKNNGDSEDSECIPHFVYWFKMQCINNDLNEDSVFCWDEDYSEDFYSWGHNSRWANTAWNYILNNFALCVEIALDLAKEHGDLNLGESK